MKTALMLLTCIAVLATRPAVSAADEFYYEVELLGSPPEILGPCNYVEHPIPGIGYFLPYTLKGYFVFDEPTSSVRFTIPPEDFTDRACPGAVETGLTFNYPVSGDPHFAATVNFGGCVTGTVHVFTRTLSVSNNCTLGSVLGPFDVPPPSSIVSIGCDAVERVITDLSECTAPPENLMPPDGATDVSINPTMTCTWASPTNCPTGVGLVNYVVYLGTDPGNLEFAGWQDYPEVIVGELEPNTTYYWRMRVADDFWLCPGVEVAWSPIMSFTTGAPLETEARTWGSIKADYQKNE